jgi:hypothetical protein
MRHQGCAEGHEKVFRLPHIVQGLRRGVLLQGSRNLLMVTTGLQEVRLCGWHARGSFPGQEQVNAPVNKAFTTALTGRDRWAWA